MTIPTFRTGAEPMPARVNAYPGTCLKCGQRVEAEAGLLESIGGRWQVKHQTCPTRTEPVEIERDFSVPDGTYTVTFSDGHHKTIRVRTQDPDATFMPGRPLLAFLSGSNNDSDYTTFANAGAGGVVHVWKRFMGNSDLREAVKVLLGDPKAASRAYAEQSGTCSRCGRTLTVPSSLHAGMGPECAKKVGW